MITNVGKAILAKYLAGQTNSPFEYMALGMGAIPTTVGAEPVGYASKVNLDFESIRVPITETSVVTEGGVTYVSLSGAIPSEQRYEFSEIGVYTDKQDYGIVTPGTKLLFGFTQTDGWEIRDSDGSVAAIQVASTVDESVNGDFDVPAAITELRALFTPASDGYFFYSARNNASTRLFSDTLLVRGDLSTITGSAGSFVIDGASDKITTGYSLNLARARSDDEISIAFSVFNKNLSEISPGVNDPDNIKLIVEFKEFASSTEYARVEIEAIDTDGAGAGAEPYDFSEDSRLVENAAIGVVPSPGYTSNTLVKSTKDFSWSNIGSVSVYLDVEPWAASAMTAADYYVALDGLSFVSKNDTNVTYGLVGYSVFQNDDAVTVTKAAGQVAKFDYKVKVDIS